MQLKKLLSFLFMALLFPSVIAQQAHFKILTLVMDKNFSFPVFTTSKDSLACSKINNLLQLSELELIHGYEKKNPFERVAIDLINPIPGKTLIQYNIHRNDSNILSMAFTQSYCHTGCNYWCTYYNFNPKNGELIFLKDIFTQEGLEEFAKLVRSVRTQKYNQLKSRVDSAQRKELDQMQECLGTDPMRNFFIKNDSIFLDRSICFGKNMIFAEMNPLEGFPLKSFSTYLNPFGKTIFGLSKENILNFHSTQLPQLFSGKIGSDAILFLLNYQPEENFTGLLFNQRSGISSQIRGSFIKDEIVLIELDNNQKEKGKIIARFAGANLEGMHYSKDKNQKSFFLIHP